jgi:hypothetical protein
MGAHVADAMPCGGPPRRVVPASVVCCYTKEATERKGLKNFLLVNSDMYLQARKLVQTSCTLRPPVGQLCKRRPPMAMRRGGHLPSLHFLRLTPRW